MSKEAKMDDIDHKILDLLVENTRIPYTDIAKKLLISAGTVHIRVKKMEEMGVIVGSSLIIDWKKIGYTFTAYVGLLINNSSQIKHIIEKLRQIPNITVAHVTSGRFNIYLKI